MQQPQDLREPPGFVLALVYFQLWLLWLERFHRKGILQVELKLWVLRVLGGCVHLPIPTLQVLNDQSWTSSSSGRAEVAQLAGSPLWKGPCAAAAALCATGAPCAAPPPTSCSAPAQAAGCAEGLGIRDGPGGWC